jgi:hypothetical protein
MTAQEHFERIFSKDFNSEINRVMFIAGYEAALNEMMDRSKTGTFSAFGLALNMYTESVKEDLKKHDAKETNNEN